MNNRAALPRLIARIVAFGLAGAILLTAPPVLARQAGDCESRVRALEEENKDLQGKPGQAQQRIRELSAQVDELRRRAATGRPSGRAPAGGPAQRPGGDRPAQALGNPLSSPRVMFETLRVQYQERFGSMPRGTRAEQNLLHAEIRKWSGEVRREITGPVEWTIRVTEIDETGTRAGGPARVSFVAGDDTEQVFSILVPAAHVRTLVDGRDTKRFRLIGRTTARVNMNPSRTEAGAVDEPRFIGPFAEFEFDFAVTDIKEAGPLN
jgi:hypothetical protein